MKKDASEQVSDTLGLDPRPEKRDNLIYRGVLRGERVISQLEVEQLADVAAKGMVTKPPLMRNPQSNML